MPKTKGGKRRELESKGEAEARANETGGLEIAGGHTFKGRKTTHMCVRLRNQEVGLGLLGGSVTLSTGFFLSNGKTGSGKGVTTGDGLDAKGIKLIRRFSIALSTF